MLAGRPPGTAWTERLSWTMVSSWVKGDHVPVQDQAPCRPAHRPDAPDRHGRWRAPGRARPKAAPGSRDTDTHDRVRTDRAGSTGTVSLRTGGRLHHIGIGRAYAGTRILLLIQDLHIPIINAATGELLRELTLDPARDYQPTGAPKGPTRTAGLPARKAEDPEP
jgi:hypothetical protein